MITAPVKSAGANFDFDFSVVVHLRSKISKRKINWKADLAEGAAVDFLAIQCTLTGARQAK